MTRDTGATTSPGATSGTTGVDALLTAQLAVAWAGEGHVGDARRLGWWRTDLVSEFGGLDLLTRLLPVTAPWAALQAVREAARRVDAKGRALANDADAVCSLYRLGFEIDERAEERLRELKLSGQSPTDALPGLAGVIAAWDRQKFAAWVASHGKTTYAVDPIGRRLTGERPAPLTALVARLVAGLVDLPEKYPLPHYRRDK